MEKQMVVEVVALRMKLMTMVKELEFQEFQMDIFYDAVQGQSLQQNVYIWQFGM